MGLYRKLGKKAQAVSVVENVLEIIEKTGVGRQVGSATTFLNCATVYKSFGMADKSIRLFEKATDIYEKNLHADDERFGGLYNNMALTLVDLKRFEEARCLNEKAIAVMKNKPLEIAITYLNMATALEAEYGLSDADEAIDEYLKKAEALLEQYENRDGYYAFVCEKCATVFGYYGNFFYENQLKERARRIYEGA